MIQFVIDGKHKCSLLALVESARCLRMRVVAKSRYKPSTACPVGSLDLVQHSDFQLHPCSPVSRHSCALLSHCLLWRTHPRHGATWSDVKICSFGFGPGLLPCLSLQTSPVVTALVSATHQLCHSQTQMSEPTAWLLADVSVRLSSPWLTPPLPLIQLCLWRRAPVSHSDHW